jgi:hypothetical protein
MDVGSDRSWENEIFQILEEAGDVVLGEKCRRIKTPDAARCKVASKGRAAQGSGLPAQVGGEGRFSRRIMGSPT